MALFQPERHGAGNHLRSLSVHLKHDFNERFPRILRCNTGASTRMPLDKTPSFGLAFRAIELISLTPQLIGKTDCRHPGSGKHWLN